MTQVINLVGEIQASGPQVAGKILGFIVPPFG